jgi:hypothetical protein
MELLLLSEALTILTPTCSPFSQRVWIALEVKQMQYQYCETDPYKRPTQLLEANPRGTVPAIREGEWACGESSIILEYVSQADFVALAVYTTKLVGSLKITTKRCLCSPPIHA